jgi:cyclic-di-GMP-binding protein
MGDSSEGEGVREEHPLADERAALELIGQLAPDPHQALAELGRWLESLKGLTELKLSRKVQIVDLIDRTARDLVLRFQGEYLANTASIKQGSESKNWTSATSFLRRLSMAYLGIVQEFQTYALGWAQIRERVPMLVARTMRVFALRLKWQLVRYAPVDKEMWQVLAQLWSYAEDAGITASRVMLYEAEESTVQGEYLRSLMLVVSAADSLTPQDVDIAERLVAHYADRFELQRHPAKTCHFFFDIEMGTAPSRYIAGTRVRPGLRFFGPGEAIKDLEALSATIASQAAIPEGTNLEGISEIERVVGVLDHLGRYWWARRANRTEERKRTLSQVLVVDGFEKIQDKLSTEGSVDLLLDDPGETWKVENESEGGYGAVLPLGAGEWVKVGTVLGVRPFDSRSWGVGIVRRLAAREDGQRYIGIQLLGRGARLVTLRRPGAAQGALNAVLLPSHVGESVSQGEVTLLLPAGGFSAQSTIVMQLYGRDYVLEPRMLLETGGDYDMAYYQIQQAA